VHNAQTLCVGRVCLGQTACKPCWHSSSVQNIYASAVAVKYLEVICMHRLVHDAELFHASAGMQPAGGSSDWWSGACGAYDPPSGKNL
jgi:hypothetical protein